MKILFKRGGFSQRNTYNSLLPTGGLRLFSVPQTYTPPPIFQTLNHPPKSLLSIIH